MGFFWLHQTCKCNLIDSHAFFRNNNVKVEQMNMPMSQTYARFQQMVKCILMLDYSLKLIESPSIDLRFSKTFMRI